MLSINCLNDKFCSLKLCIKYKFVDYIVNNIRLIQNLTDILWVYKTYNSTLRFSKYYN